MLSKKTFIAIEAVLYVACQTGERPVRSKDICEYQGVTLRYLEHIMQQMVHDQILRGLRGPKGGYVLARDRRKILLSDIYDSMSKLQDEDEKMVSSDIAKHVVFPLQKEMRNNLRDSLQNLTILDLFDRCRERKVDIVQSQFHDFAI
jgi:Rrf2 family transcriptional regulator, iron-sulfur cluster assembly transcription factor